MKLSYPPFSSAGEAARPPGRSSVGRSLFSLGALLLTTLASFSLGDDSLGQGLAHLRDRLRTQPTYGYVEPAQAYSLGQVEVLAQRVSPAPADHAAPNTAPEATRPDADQDTADRVAEQAEAASRLVVRLQKVEGAHRHPRVFEHTAFGKALQRRAPALAVPSLKRLRPLGVEELRRVDTETLWLARCILSETNRVEEQELVAWVVRNRVETGYRGKRSYREVVLDPYQFSAFNPESTKRSYFASLEAQTQDGAWQKALRVAYEVRRMDGRVRPFSVKTRHFYSARSMVGGKAPGWAEGRSPVRPLRGFALEAERFRFYEKIG